MRMLILGSTGLLGQEVVRQAQCLGHEAIGAARSGAERKVDVADFAGLAQLLAETKPDVVVNCAAIVDLNACERDPGLSYAINARPAALLADWAQGQRRLVQISTDHFFSGEGPRPKSEDEPVTLLNEYARTKYAAEAFALTSSNALVLRTSIVGLRGWKAPTFAEWALEVIARAQPATLFSDAWTSSIDVATFTQAMFALINGNVTGRLNLAAREVYTKEAFVRELARQQCRPLHATSGTLRQTGVRRGTSLGLDVSRASELLSKPLPSLQDVVASILKQANDRAAQ